MINSGFWDIIVRNSFFYMWKVCRRSYLNDGTLWNHQQNLCFHFSSKCCRPTPEVQSDQMLNWNIYLILLLKAMMIFWSIWLLLFSTKYSSNGLLSIVSVSLLGSVQWQLYLTRGTRDFMIWLCDCLLRPQPQDIW